MLILKISKKDLEREKYQAIDYASEKFAKDLLSTIDTLEMALQSATCDAPAEELLPKLKEGIELTLKNLINSFEKNHISAVESDEFDPEHHNAVMQVNSDEHEHGAIVQVLQKGYKLKDRLLRPAMVSICQK
jgi:molecular chaperone GrpE